eukprot:2850482-Heterocapsa_arctica.AAC.1
MTWMSDTSRDLVASAMLDAKLRRGPWPAGRLDDLLDHDADVLGGRERWSTRPGCEERVQQAQHSAARPLKDASGPQPAAAGSPRRLQPLSHHHGPSRGQDGAGARAVELAVARCR